MLKIVALLFYIIVSTNCGVIRKRSNESRPLLEIISTLEELENQEVYNDECRGALVADIFTQMEEQNATETFCKAIIALRKLGDSLVIQQNLKKLRTNLEVIGSGASNCTTNNDSEVSLCGFLQQLLDVARRAIKRIN